MGKTRVTKKYVRGAIKGRHQFDQLGLLVAAAMGSFMQSAGKKKLHTRMQVLSALEPGSNVYAHHIRLHWRIAVP